MITWIVIGILLIILVVGLYFLYVYVEAKLEVKASPREEMFMCDVHGAFRKKHVIKFLDYEMCPRCFDQKLKMPLDSTIEFK